MVNLGIRVFESYTLQDILGENPPISKNLEEKLALETSRLVERLGKKSKTELEQILANHVLAKKEITKFSGAQAMSQDKLELFHGFLSKFIKEIESRLADK